MNRSLSLSALLTVFWCASSFGVHAQATYSLTPIGPEPGDIPLLFPNDLNEKGEVVGVFRSMAFLWRDGVLIDLPDLTGGASRATGINNRSDVVGVASTSELPDLRRGFLFRHGEIIDIGAPPGGALNIEPSDINNRGDIIGDLPDEFFGPRVFLRRKSGEFIILEPLPGAGDFPFVTAVEINERGDVVGTSSSPGAIFAVIWRDGVVESLGTLQGFAISNGLAINDRGQVVGVAFRPGDERQTAFLWDRGELSALPSPSSAENASTIAFDINNRGQIVGSTDPAANLPDQIALLWEQGIAYELTELIREDDPLEPFVTLVIGLLINNRGQIVAAGFDSRNPTVERHYLLTPTP